MPDIYDLLIVGGGPGGLAAGVYGSRGRLKTAILEKGRPGGQAATTEELENYPGIFGLTGPAMMDQFAAHAQKFGTEIIRATVVDLDLKSDVKKITASDGAEYLAHSVVLAPGAEPRSMNIKGEHRLRGRGVSYCATCDADFFEELDIVVLGNGDTAIEEAMYLTKFAETVTIIVAQDEGVLACNKASAEKAFANPKIKWVWNSVVEEICGEELVESLSLKNIKTGEESSLEIHGVFVFVGTVPKTEFLKGHIALDDEGYIITNEAMETDVEGVFAAGDARAKYLRQVITAAADGAIAAVTAEKYLMEHEAFRTQVLEATKPVLLTFWAARVPESIPVVSVLEQYVTDNPEVALVKMGAYRDKKTADRYEVTQVPTVILFRGGKPVGRLEGGGITAEQVQNLLTN
ncbi:MAG: thioredoxin-disulfide reductase [Oscillospiraceae bacterium]|nr:thioredoxin-disulfide reductase [Oscillospiraceae bacterium]